MTLREFLRLVFYGDSTENAFREWLKSLGLVLLVLVFLYLTGDDAP